MGVQNQRVVEVPAVVFSGLGRGGVGHQSVPRSTLMVGSLDVNPVGNLLVDRNLDAVLSEIVHGVGVGLGMELGDGDFSSAALGQQDGMNAAAGPNFQDMLVAEIKLHQHVAQMDAVRRGVPYPSGTSVRVTTLQTAAAWWRDTDWNPFEPSNPDRVHQPYSNLLDGAKESNPAQPFREAGPEISVLSENCPCHDEEQLVRRCHHQNSQGPKHPW